MDKIKNATKLLLEGLEKAKRKPIGATSPDGKYKKVAEGKWVPVEKKKEKKKDDEKLKDGKYKMKDTFTGYDGKSYDAIYTAEVEDGKVISGKGEYFSDGEWQDTHEDGEDINEQMEKNIKKGNAKRI